MTHLDLLSAGFGPAAIAVAAAIEDEAEFLPAGSRRMRTLFLERAASSAWQPNMLLPGTDIQHHFLRDFACPRNPRSRFTFPNYLKETGKLYPFTSMGCYVSRHEWSEYVEWTARQLAGPVRYNSEVLEVAPVADGGRVLAARVTSRDTRTGEVREDEARNVMVSIGHQPWVPEEFSEHLGERVFHAAELLPRLEPLDADAPLRFAVIGAGQNAGEIFLHLAQAFRNAEISSLARNAGFRMYNLGHFSNQAYYPEETEYFYALDRPQREAALAEVYTTNYACVDPDVSTALYQTVYADHYFGPQRLHVRKRTAVDALEQLPDGSYRLALREVNTGEASQLDADVVVVCTGFVEPRLPAMIEGFRPYVLFDESGEPVVSRAFRLGTVPECEVGIYLNGITEWRHGINTAASFSTMALKAELIMHDLEAHLSDPATASAAADPAAR